MNKLFHMIVVAVWGILLGACTPDTPELPDANIDPAQLIQGQAFTVTPDTSNPNIIYLESKMKGYTPLWEHPQGRSQEQKVTLKIPFAGVYSVKFGVLTRGGYVYADVPFSFELSSNCLEFVSSELWTNLTGGVGEEKVWVYDNGKYGQNKGEMAYADPSVTQEWHNFECNWEPGANHVGDKNIWSSTMTFGVNPEKGAYAQMHNTYTDGEAVAEKDEEGSFMFDEDSHLLNFTDCNIMHPESWDFKTTNWNSKLRVLELTENQLRVAVLRETVSGESEWWMVFNYVSKAWADENESEPEPTLPDNFEDLVGSVTTTAIKWVLSPATPFNWADLAGESLNPTWTDKASYPDWSGWDTADASAIADFSLTLDSKDNSAIYVAPDGTTTEGTYTLDTKGIYTFSFDIDFNICSWVNCQTVDKQWRILQIKQNLKGEVTGMWVGKREGDQYMTYLLVPGAGGQQGGGSTTTGTALAFDGSKIQYGDLEGKGNLRADIYNEWGATGQDPSVDKTAANFENSISVNFTISGTGITGGNYTPQITFCNGTYSVIYWSAGDSGNAGVSKNEGDVVTGDGTYTVTLTSTTASTGLTVFCVDVLGLMDDVANKDAVFMKINSIVLDGKATAPTDITNLPVDPAKITTGDIEENGNLRIELCNTTNANSIGPAMDLEKLAFAETITIRFRLAGVTLKAGAPESYATALAFASGDWSFSYWGGDATCDTTVTGDGTYTVKAKASSIVSGSVVCCIDVKGLAAQVEDLTAVKAYVDAIELK